VGADFLSAHNLSVDLASMKLVHSSEWWSVPLSAPPISGTFAAIGVQLLAPSPSQRSGGTREAGVAAVDLRGPLEPLPLATARSSPRQIFHGSKKEEFPTIRGAPDPSLAASSTPKFRALEKHKPTRLPGKVKSLRATCEKEGEYPSSAGSPGPHVNVATPFPPPRVTLPAPANPALSHSPLHRQKKPVGGVSADLAAKVVATAASIQTGGKSRDQGAKVAASPDYQSVLESFPAVLNKSEQLPSAIHNVQHVIDTSDRPVSSRYRRLDPEKLAAAKKEFEDLERQGIIRRSSSSWSSPLHMVKKPDGTWRPCGDFRRLNLQTTPDRYTCPNMADLTSRLHGCTVFSKLDLRKGYHQVPVDEESIKMTAIITPFGLLSFCVCHLGYEMRGRQSRG